MIHIMNNLFIPESELTFTASRSGGPGGQNVNKVSSRVTLLFDVSRSAVLSADQKRMILSKLSTRINKDNILRIVSQRTRSQEVNRADTIERFSDLLYRALAPKQVRIKTRIPTAAKERRLESKKKHTITKQGRSKRGWDS
jgi:ribosome-associated protein